MPDQHDDLDYLPLAAEIRRALQRQVLSAADRERIHARVMELAGDPGGRARLRRAWPQLVHLGRRPAVVGGAAAAVIAVVGLAALREWRGQGGEPVLKAA